MFCTVRTVQVSETDEIEMKNWTQKKEEISRWKERWTGIWWGWNTGNHLVFSWMYD